MSATIEQQMAKIEIFDLSIMLFLHQAAHTELLPSMEWGMWLYIERIMPFSNGGRQKRVGTLWIKVVA